MSSFCNCERSEFNSKRPSSATGHRPLDSGELDLKVDYIMHAKTKRWDEMGAGKYGPMKGMMLFRLKFSGPKLEAMGNMAPFTNFLLLAGSVPSDSATCP